MMRSSNGDMPFLQHLSELRTRLVHAIAAIALGSILTYSWAGSIMQLLTAPIRFAFPDLKLIGTGPAEAFICRLQVAIASGALVACPYVFFQFWLFIAPGLHESEKKIATPFILSSTLFFLAGVSFCYQLVLPVAFGFFSDEFTSLGLSPDIRIGEYLPFMLKLLIVFGIVFELPILAYFLARGRILTAKMLLSNFRYSVVIIFILAAVLTPPDVISQLLLATPLLAIYGISILICQYVEKKQQPRAS